MIELVGLLIGLAVGLTGVGGGSLTAPVLMLFFNMRPVDAVGTALLFSAVIKLAVVPVYIFRKQVSWKVVGWLSVGGVPGVMLGFYLIGMLRAARQEKVVYLVVGVTIMFMALYNLWRSMRPAKFVRMEQNRFGWLSLVAAAIGTEVGFSSAGAGALGSVALLSLTTLAPAMVVGTDTTFGLVLSMIGGTAHVSAGNYELATSLRLIAGGVVGALVGANVASLVAPKALKLALLSWLTFIGGQLCWRGFGW